MRLLAVLAAMFLSCACGSESPRSPTNPSVLGLSRSQPKTATITSLSFTPTEGVFGLNGVASTWRVAFALIGFSPTETLYFYWCLTDPVTGAICTGEPKTVRDLTSPTTFTSGGYIRSATVVDADFWILDGPARVPAFPAPIQKFYDHKHVDVSIRFLP